MFKRQQLSFSIPSMDTKAAGRKRLWSPEEDVRLRDIMAARTDVDDMLPAAWRDVARQISGRSGKQCRERWKNHLDPSLTRTPWTPEDDARIMELRARLGNQWKAIAAAMPGRSENAIKNRHYSSVRREERQRKRLGHTPVKAGPRPVAAVAAGAPPVAPPPMVPGVPQAVAVAPAVPDFRGVPVMVPGMAPHYVAVPSGGHPAAGTPAPGFHPAPAVMGVPPGCYTYSPYPIPFAYPTQPYVMPWAPGGLPAPVSAAAGVPPMAAPPPMFPSATHSPVTPCAPTLAAHGLGHVPVPASTGWVPPASSAWGQARGIAQPQITPVVDPRKMRSLKIRDTASSTTVDTGHSAKRIRTLVPAMPTASQHRTAFNLMQAATENTRFMRPVVEGAPPAAAPPAARGAAPEDVDLGGDDDSGAHGESGDGGVDRAALGLINLHSAEQR